MKQSLKVMIIISAFLLILCVGEWEAYGQAADVPAAAASGQTAPAAHVVDVPSATSPTGPLQLQSSTATEKLHLVVGQSMMLRGTSPIRRIFVGNPTILQTYTAGPQETVLTAKAAGRSSLVIWDESGKSAMYTVSADSDPAGLQQSLQDAYPDGRFEVQGSEERLALVGTVPTQEMADAAGKLALTYSKEIVNSLRVVPVHAKQVQLKLRIAEVDRAKLQQFGVDLNRSSGNNVVGTSTSQFPTTVTSTATGITASDPLNLFFSNLSSGYSVTVKDLEQKDILQILAEPNLTTLSGQPARFLSGGEFPFPVAQGGSGSTAAITIMFRPYGVKVDFTPVVNADGTIHLKIAPEVSTLDYTNEVTISGFTVPAISTRRTETEVELNDGQTFAISGLLDRRDTDELSKLPGIASIPILGQLFRSKSLKPTTTELIMVVTASVIDPLGKTQPVPDIKFPLPFLNVEKFDHSGLEPAKKAEEDHK